MSLWDCQNQSVLLLVCPGTYMFDPGTCMFDPEVTV